MPRLSPTVEELVAGAELRQPMSSTDSKSGARFERVVIDGEPFVLKHVDTRFDWLMRQSGDIGPCAIVLWERDVLDIVPAFIDHTIVGAAREGRGGAVLMRDVHEWLVPPDNAPIPLAQHLQFVEHLARFHASCWGWNDTVGLVPFANRCLMFGPTALACEAALGFPEPVPRIATEGWARLAVVAPDTAAAIARVHAEPWPLLDALARGPCTFQHGDWKLGNLGTEPGGRTVLVDWSLSGAGPPLLEVAHYVALNVARLPLGQSKEDTFATYRESLERAGIDTAPWWDRQLRLCLLVMTTQLGWEKAFDPTGLELDWWRRRVDEGIAELARG